MKADQRHDTIQLLRRASSGDIDARDKAWSRVYDEVLHVAAAQRRRWSGNWTLETRVLANEVFIKLYGKRPPSLEDRKHFFRLVSRAIRQILVSYSEERRAAKRGGGQTYASLTQIREGSLQPEACDEILDLHRALSRFESLDARAALVVELRFFGGFSYEEIAATTELSRATVVRDWSIARSWLHRELRDLPGLTDLPDSPPPRKASGSW